MYETKSESPVHISRNRFVRIAVENLDFFKVRTPENNENKEVFVVWLELAEEKQFDEVNKQLKEIWQDVAESVGSKLNLEPHADKLEALRKLAHQDEKRRTTELGAALQHEFEQRIKGARNAGIVKMAREVEAYVPMGFAEAVDLYRRDRSLFADGFYSLIDPSQNTAKEASEYLEIVSNALKRG